MGMRNTEVYPNPVITGAVVNNSGSDKQLVYIASPFAGDTDGNANKARDYCRFAVKRGFIPLAPHLLFPQFMDEADLEQRRLGLSFALNLLRKCDELWVFGETVSSGMSREIAQARTQGIPIRFFNSRCQEVTENGC
jgi:hypothetical protein